MNKHCLAIGLLFSILNISAQNKNIWANVDYKTIYEYQDTRNSLKLLKYFKSNNYLLRKQAVLAFASVQDTAVVKQLLKVLKKDKNPEVRASAAYSLGQLRRSWLFDELVKRYAKEPDIIVRGFLLEAIGKCANYQVISFLEGVEFDNKVYNSTISNQFARSVYFASRRGFKSDSIIQKLKYLTNYHLDSFILYVYKTLIKKIVININTVIGKIDLSLNECMDSLKGIKNPYLKVSFIDRYHLGQEALLSFAFSDEHNFVKSYCMEQYFKEKSMNIGIINKCLVSGNLAFVAMAAEKVRTDSLWRDSAEQKVRFLINVRQKLTMPRDFEAYVELEKTISYLNHKSYQYVPPAYNHPADWQYIASLNRIEKVRILTDKGAMIMTCDINDVPVSSSNFLKLVDSSFYNGKYFHRMVPDFVVQGGCPRGDGWGALNWTQRSEFHSAYTYKKGSVGLASAGKDSEGVQFFITHGYTPSLDGRYTIFGEITEGLDIIDLLKVGDKIISIERIK